MLALAWKALWVVVGLADLALGAYCVWLGLPATKSSLYPREAMPQLLDVHCEPEEGADRGLKGTAHQSDDTPEERVDARWHLPSVAGSSRACARQPAPHEASRP